MSQSWTYKQIIQISTSKNGKIWIFMVPNIHGQRKGNFWFSVRFGFSLQCSTPLHTTSHCSTHSHCSKHQAGILPIKNVGAGSVIHEKHNTKCLSWTNSFRNMRKKFDGDEDEK